MDSRLASHTRTRIVLPTLPTALVFLEVLKAGSRAEFTEGAWNAYIHKHTYTFLNHLLGYNRPHLTFPFNRLEPTDPTELERVRQYASQQTRMYSHLLGNLVPLNADKVRLHARKHTELDGWMPRLAHHPITTLTIIGRAGPVRL